MSLLAAPNRTTARPLPSSRREPRAARSSREKARPVAGGEQAAPRATTTAATTATADRHATQWVHVAVATLAVLGAPIALVWTLRAGGLVTSAILSVLIGMGASLAISQLGCRLWEKHPASEDLLFSELMLWGYVNRLRAKRRLASAVQTLGPMGRGARGAAIEGMSARQRTRMLERLVSSVETRDPYLHGHSRRVARHAWMVARRMGLSHTEVARIRTAAALHDVGKVETPNAILHKAGALDDREYAVIKRHPVDGAEMTTVLEDERLTAMVRHHHERMDGSGYPAGLRGEEIPLGARIIAVADTFDAITSARPYRPKRAHIEAIEILKQEAGLQLDPEVVRTFCAHYAGRRSIALSSFLGSLPQRPFELLGGGLSSAASAAKMAVLAAAIGGAAATSAAVALPSAHHGPAQAAHPHAAAAAAAAASGSAARSAPRASAAAAHAARVGAQPAARQGAQAAAALAAAPASAASAVASTPPATGRLPSPAKPGSSPGASQRPSAGGTSGTAPTHGRSGGTPGATHGHKATKPEAAGSRGKSEASRGASEEAHGNSEEAHGQSGEAHGGAEEARGSSEEAHGSAEAGHPSGRPEEPQSSGGRAGGSAAEAKS